MDPGPDRCDPFEGLRLDDDFVRGALVKEPSAAQRAHYRVPEPSASRAPGGRAGRRRRRQLRVERLRQRIPGAGPQHRWQRSIGALVLVVAGLWWLRPASAGDPAVPVPSTAALVSYRGAADRYPPPPADRSDHPLGTPPPVPARHGAFAFAQRQTGSDEPVAYDPCRPIHLVVNLRTAPPDGEELVREAAAAVAKASGLRIEVDGTTTERLGRTRRPIQVARYGDRWAPVLVTWTDDVQVPALAFDVAGLGGSRALPLPSGDQVYVTGFVALDGPQLQLLRDGFDGRVAVRAVIEHELGHVVGLAHVEDSSQLMAGSMHAGVDSFGSGDRAGLARLGAGRCFANG